MKKKTQIPIRLKVLFYTICISMILYSCKENEQSQDYTKIVAEGEMQAELTTPPMVPKPVGNRAAMKLKVNMELRGFRLLT